MILQEWASYLPPPGSQYRVTYEPDGHIFAPDLQAFERSLDARPGVAVKSVTLTPATRTNPGGLVVATLSVFLGDSPLVTALGSFHSDGSHFWRVQQVERTDNGVPNRVQVTVQRVIDAALDPVQDIASAGGSALSEVTDKVRNVGIPGVAIVGVAALAFLFFRR